MAAKTPLTASVSKWQADPTEAATSLAAAIRSRPDTPGMETCGVVSLIGLMRGAIETTP